MRIEFDENIPSVVREHLSSRGHDVHTVIDEASRVHRTIECGRRRIANRCVRAARRATTPDASHFGGPTGAGRGLARGLGVGLGFAGGGCGPVGAVGAGLA